MAEERVQTSLTSSELDDLDGRRAAATAVTGGPNVDITGAGTGVPGSTTAAEASDDPEVIRQQIERTREDMSDTLNELQHRLSPQHLASQAKESVREATVGRVQQLVGTAGDRASHVAGRAQEAAETVVTQAREHPIPVALAGAGAGLIWWLMRRSTSAPNWSSEHMYDWDDADATYDRDYATLDLEANALQGEDRPWTTATRGWTSIFRDNPLPASIAAASIGYMLWNSRSAAGDSGTVGARSTYRSGEDWNESSIGSSVSETARDVRRQARETAHAIGEQVGDTVRSAQARASEVSQDVTRRVRRVRYQTSSQFERWMDENPVAVGVAALAAGAAVGLSVRRTRTEDHVMGASRDALIDKASDQAQYLKEQVKDKVQAVTDLTSSSDTRRGDDTTHSSTSGETTGV